MRNFEKGVCMLMHISEWVQAWKYATSWQVSTLNAEGGLANIE